MSEALPYVIYCRDKAGASSVRAANIHLHRAYLEQTKTRILLAGPLMNEDRSQAVGSLFVIKAASREEAQAFNAGDPFHGLDIWETIEIVPFTVSRHSFLPA